MRSTARMPLRPPASSLLFTALSALLLLRAPGAAAQEADEGRKVYCEPSRAVALVEEQLSEAKAFEDASRRVAVMTRAADLLWTFDEPRARLVLNDAFDIASSHYRQHGDEERVEKGRGDSKMPGLSVQLPDQRFVVIRAAAKRDRALAEEFAGRVEDDTPAFGKPAKWGERAPRVGYNLAVLAEQLWETDRDTALQMARLSFRFPATHQLPHLLYKIAETDRPQADALFREALAAYASRDIEDLLYLSPYPFGYFDAVAEVRVTSYIRPPAAFNLNPATQRLFIETFLAAGERRLDAATAQAREADVPSPLYTDRGQIFTAVSSLEPVIARQFPNYSERAAMLKARAAADIAESEIGHMTAFARRRRGGVEPKPAADAPGGFGSLLAQAEREKNPERRDQILTMGLQSKILTESLESVLEVVRKISDPDTRRQMSDYVYFQRGNKAAKDGATEEAARLAEKIEALQYRALLLLLVAEQGLKSSDDRARADQLLDAVIKAADKSPESEARARALLGAAHLYARFNYLRGLQVMGDAVKSVNKVPGADYTTAFLLGRVEGKTFSMFTSYPVPGYSLENAFRELGTRDFEGALSAARAIDDKQLRGVAMLTIAGKCLEDSKKQEKQQRPKPAPAAQD